MCIVDLESVILTLKSKPNLGVVCQEVYTLFGSNLNRPYIMVTYLTPVKSAVQRFVQFAKLWIFNSSACR